MNIEKLLATGRTLPQRLQNRFETIQIVYGQQKYMYKNHVRNIDNRIVSISQPHIRPIVRGKAKAKIEFGAKLDISVSEGYTRLETFSFESYNEATLLKEIAQRYHDRTGHYPERVLADKIYRNRENLGFCKEHGIRLSRPALGRPKKDVEIDKKQEYADICDRVEVERKISLAKRKCGLGLLSTRLSQTTAGLIALSILLLNLRKIWRAFFHRVQLFLVQFILRIQPQFMPFVQ